jgi:hypothetical protein
MEVILVTHAHLAIMLLWKVFQTIVRKLSWLGVKIKNFIMWHPIEKAQDLGAQWSFHIINNLDIGRRISTVHLLNCFPNILDCMEFMEDDFHYVIGIILIEIPRLFFYHNPTYGWIKISMLMVCNFLTTWRIHLEILLRHNGAPLVRV